MLGWFGELNPGERRTMGACFGGWALDAFDVQMYRFVIPTVIALWGVSRGEAGLIGTGTLLLSSLGGWFLLEREVEQGRQHLRRQLIAPPITLDVITFVPIDRLSTLWRASYLVALRLGPGNATIAP